MSYTTNKSVGNLTAVSGLGSNDLAPISQSGLLKKATLAELETFVFRGKTVRTATALADTVVVKDGENLRTVTLENLLPANSVKQTALTDNCVGSAELKNSAGTDTDRAVNSNHIRDYAVTANKLGNSAVSERAMGANSVNGSAIQDAQIDNRHVAPGSIEQTRFSEFVVAGSVYAPSQAPFNPYGVTESYGVAIPSQGISQLDDSPLKQAETSITIKNSNSGWQFSLRACSPVFAGWTQNGTTTASKGGAYSGGVLMPDGSVFLVPYNQPPALYYPDTDRIEQLDWPGGEPPFGTVANANYALYNGGVLIPSNSNNTVHLGDSQNPNNGAVVVCAPYYAKKALIFNPATHSCSYGPTSITPTLADRAFAGISLVPANRLVGTSRCALMIPKASGPPRLIDRSGNISQAGSTSFTGAEWGGAQLNMNSSDMFFGTRYYRPSSGSVINFGAGVRVYHYPALASAGSNVTVSVSDSGGIYLTSAGQADLLGNLPAAADVDGYLVSGIVPTGDAWALLVPGFWGAGTSPQLVLAEAQTFGGTPPTGPIVSLSLPIGTNLATNTDTPAPGNGLFSGGVHLLDGRVFLVPCTSTKAFTLRTRDVLTSLPPEYILGPYMNKR